MPVFEIQAPNGKTYEVEGPNAQGALEALQRTLSPPPQSQVMDDALAAGSQASRLFGGPTEPNLIDRAQSYAQGVIEGLPVVGPALSDARVELDALIAQLPGGMTPDQVRREAANRKAFLQEKAGNERLAGQITGAVAPLTVAGLAAPATVGRALGMTGGLGSQTIMGALSGIGLVAADTKARGGDWTDAGITALAGGAIGGAAPIAIKGAGAAWNAMTRQGVPTASRNVAQALTEDGLDAGNLNRLMAEQGPDTMLMDMGDNLRTLGGGIAANRGPGQKVLRNAINERDAGAVPRVSADIARTIGNGQEIGALTESIIAAQKAAADPLYSAVRDVPVDLVGGIKFVAQTPLGQRAFKEALALAANDGVPTNSLTIGIVDYAKQALDDIASSAKRAGQNNAARQAGQMARMLTTEADKIAPGYQAARQAFAGPAAVLDAIESGRGTFKGNMSPADMQRLMANMTGSEKDAFLQGAQTAVADMLGNSANDVATVRTLLRKPYNEAKLRLLIGSEGTDDLLRAVDRELLFGQTANAVSRNSETARRSMASGMVNPQQQDIYPQGVPGMVFAAINAARQKLRSVTQPRVNNQMAEILSSKALSPQDIARLTAGQAAPRSLPVAPATLPLLSPPGSTENRPLRVVVQRDR